MGELDDILTQVREHFDRWVVWPSQHASVAVALWVAHTWLFDIQSSSPRLALLSPEYGSGKTRVLEVLELLVRQPIFTHSISLSALFRTVHADDVTVLFDETDALWGAKDDNAESIRSLINAGHRKGVKVYRMVGQGAAMQTQAFNVYCPVALAGVGKLPDSVMTRSVIVNMRRRRPDEHVMPFEFDDAEVITATTRDALAQWASSDMNKAKVGAGRPKMPPEVVDRPADVWRPLIAIADAAGGEWPRLAREAAVDIVREAGAREKSPGQQLLEDIRFLFERHDTDRFPSSVLCAHLAGIEESPWGDAYGKQLDPHGLARRLRGYDIRPRTIRMLGGDTPKGYVVDDFRDAWARYLPAVSSPEKSPQAPQAQQARDPGAGETPQGATETPQDATNVADVADVADVAAPRGRDGDDDDDIDVF